MSPAPAPGPLSVCSFESRRQEEMIRLIEKSGGTATMAASMKEVSLDDNQAAFEFAEKLLSDQFDLVIFMTGVGAEALIAALATRNLDGPVLEKLQSTLTAARGPKPVAALSKMKVRVAIRAPEPNTWQDLAAELERQSFDFSGKRIAVQEYGEPSHSFYQWLEERGASVFRVPVYRWALPDDVRPLEEAIQRTITGDFDILLWTSAQQMIHVLEVADRLGLKETWLDAARRCVIGSIGPTASERLRECGLPPDLEPSHPKMAHLIRETIAAAPEIRKTKLS